MIQLKLSFRAWTWPCRLRLVTLAGVLALFTACAVGPDYVKPPTQVPVSYKELEGWKVAQPRDHLIRGAWWEIFNDPRLNELEEQVNISSQSVAAAEAQFRQARALVWAARAAYFPTATIGLGYTRSSGSTTLTPGTTTQRTSLNDFMLLGDVSWEADVWGKVRRSVEASKASAQASAADLESTRLLVQTELAQNYLQLRTLDAQKQLLDETVIAFQKSLELTKNRYAAGVASKGDVLLADTQGIQAVDQAVRPIPKIRTVGVKHDEVISREYSILFSEDSDCAFGQRIARGRVRCRQDLATRMKEAKRGGVYGRYVDPRGS